MHTSIIFVCALLALATAQNVTLQNFQYNGSPIQVQANQTYITSFSNNIGSQFAVWVPSNVSRIFINWTRSDQSDECQYSAYAYLYGKWGTFPCAAGYDSFSAECESNQDSFGYSYYAPLLIQLDAYDAGSLYYWDSISGRSGTDFIRGDWLYLDSYLDISNSNCTAALQVSFDYCPSGTIAAYLENGGNGADTTCVPYTTVNSLSFTQSSSIPSAGSKYYLVTVPANASGIQFNLNNVAYSSLYIYSRPSSGGGAASYYNYESYDTSLGNGIYNYTLWVALPSPGEWVLTIEDYYGGSASNYTYDAQIYVKTCPAGWAADEAGNCLYPLSNVTSVQLASANLNLGPYNSAVNYDCNWAFYSYYSPANQVSSLNMSLSLPYSSARIVWRKNAIPGYNKYDGYTYYNTTLYFTPEDFAANKPTYWYFGFCNYDSTSNATFTVAATSYTAPSAAASASSTPVAGASPSPGSGSSGEDSSSAFSLAASMLLVLAAFVLLF